MDKLWIMLNDMAVELAFTLMLMGKSLKEVKSTLSKSLEKYIDRKTRQHERESEQHIS